MFKKINQAWKNFLERLAKENEQENGGKRMSCCDLNKQKEKL